MTVKIYLPSPLRRYTANESSLAVKAQTVGDALEALFVAFPQLRRRVLDEQGHLFPYLILLHGCEELARNNFAYQVLQPGDELDLVPAVEGGSDVRMQGFRQRASFEEARAEAFRGLQRQVESSALMSASRRVLARAVTSTVDVPAFDRAAMDGYAVHAEDSFGATNYDALNLKMVGESMPAAQDLSVLAPGTAMRIMTGAPLPPGADAVLMAEDAEEIGGEVLVKRALPPGKHVGRRGEDVALGEEVLPAGRWLRPQDIGLLA